MVFLWVLCVAVFVTNGHATRRRIASPNLRGTPGKGYLLQMSLGTPEQDVFVLVDTGSSNFAVAAADVELITQYFHTKRSSTYVNYNSTVHSEYTVGSWTGELASEVVSSPWIPGGPIRVDVVAITESHQVFHRYHPMQGILGLAYKTGAKGSATPVFDSLVHESRVPNIFSMQLCGTVRNGTNSTTNTSGTMVFDGIDDSLYVLPVVYTPVVEQRYYDVVITRMMVGQREVNLPCAEFNDDKTVVDSGTAGLRLPQNVYNVVISHMKNLLNDISFDEGSFNDCWSGETLICWRADRPRFESFPTLSIFFLSDEGNDREFMLLVKPQMYLLAQSDPQRIRSDCYVFGIMPSASGTVLGTVLMEGYYVIFDRLNSRVGFAQSTCPISDPTFTKPTIKTPKQRLTSTDCRHTSSLSQNLKGAPGKGYTLQLEIGSPPQMLDVLVDTGSSNFAVAAAPVESVKNYFHIDRSSSYHNLHKTVTLDYTIGHWSGTLSNEVITFSSIPGGPITVEMAMILESDEFFKNLPMQGILGLAYKTLSRPGGSVTPVFDYLVNDHRVGNIFSMQLCGTVDKGTNLDVSIGGTMVFNGTDPSLYVPPIVYTPLAKEWYYDVLITRMMVGQQEVDMPCAEFNNDKTIVDSGTTSLRLPVKVYNTVLSLIKNYTGNCTAGVVLDDKFWNGGNGYLCWPPHSPDFSSFPTLTVFLLSDNEDEEFELLVLPQMYLQAYPDPENKQRDCYKFSIMPSTSGTVLGAVVMEGYYVIFDRTNSRVGFAQSTCQIRDPQFAKPSVSHPQARSSLTGCRHPSDSSMSFAIIITLVVSSVVFVLSLVIVITVSCLCCKRKRRPTRYNELTQTASKDDGIE
ncbi:beta-secretase 1-like [Corticium candelabrum]|uniref:beta-secretase 1-like n=1 Tax=Corticium candelabrum TaxID=121492 RepID=UPI002E259DAC|nr:beta-secretase 1-like [Corticium candelabrum]